MEMIKDRVYRAKEMLIEQVNNMRRDNSVVLFHQSAEAEAIIEDIEESNSMLTVTLLDAYIPHEQRSYSISFCRTIFFADKLEIYSKDDYNVCDIIYYDDNMCENNFQIKCLKNEYFKLTALDNENEFGIEIMQLPPWQLSDNITTGHLLRAFPIIETRDKTRLDANGKITYSTEMYAYLNPFMPDKVFIKGIDSRLESNLSVHNSNVRFSRDRFAMVNTLALTTGAVLVLYHPIKKDVNGVYELESIDNGLMTCIKITPPGISRTDNVISIPVGILDGDDILVQILYATENVFCYSREKHELSILHNGHLSDDGEMLDVIDKTLGIIEAVNEYDDFSTTKYKELLELIDRGEAHLYNKLVVSAEKLYCRISKAMDDLRNIRKELSEGNINLYLIDSQTFIMLDSDLILQAHSSLGKLISQIHMINM